MHLPDHHFARAYCLIVVSHKSRQTNGSIIRANRGRATASKSCLFPATRSIAQKKRCRSWERFWLSITDSIAAYCLRSIRRPGFIDPNNRRNIPGMSSIKDADLIIVFLRRRDLPDDDMQVLRRLSEGRQAGHWNSYGHACVHARSRFEMGALQRSVPRRQERMGRRIRSPRARRTLDQSSRQSQARKHARHYRAGCCRHPILRGIKDGEIWGSTDVYAVRLPLPGDSQPLVLGQVTARKGQVRRIGPLLRHATG